MRLSRREGTVNRMRSYDGQGSEMRLVKLEEEKDLMDWVLSAWSGLS